MRTAFKKLLSLSPLHGFTEASAGIDPVAVFFLCNQRVTAVDRFN